MITADQIGGIVRALAAAVGGYFVGQGVIDAETATALAGAAVTIATAIWSVWSKKKSV